MVRRRMIHSVFSVAVVLFGLIDSTLVVCALYARDRAQDRFRDQTRRVQAPMSPLLTRSCASAKPLPLDYPELTRKGEGQTEEIIVRFPQGEIPTQYVLFGRERFRSCLIHWRHPSVGWANVEPQVDPHIFHLRPEPPPPGDDTLLLAVTIRVETPHNPVHTVLHTFALTMPRYGTRRWDTLHVHPCTPRELSRRRHGR